jgi:hypothetical protein
MANTLETSDSVKYLGVRSIEKIDFNTCKEISFDLDWNNQQNGCYLTAALYICPTESQNPKKEKDWIEFEWSGTPAGKNIRVNVLTNVNGVRKKLYVNSETQQEEDKLHGWQVKPGNHQIKLLIDSKSILTWADGKQLCDALHLLDFTSGYLYLQLSSGANYPSREVYLDNIMVIERGN